MDKAFRQARKEVGLPRFERNCRVIDGDTGRRKKAYAVPGTQEAGRHAMLCRMASNIAARARRTSD